MKKLVTGLFITMLLSVGLSANSGLNKIKESEMNYKKTKLEGAIKTGKGYEELKDVYTEAMYNAEVHRNFKMRMKNRRRLSDLAKKIDKNNDLIVKLETEIKLEK
jgi:hypothetical protein